MLLRRERQESLDASAGLGAWHSIHGRIATPPDLSKPGPFVTVRYRTTLAAASLWEVGKDFWTGTDPPR